MTAALLIDFGSTFTKLRAVDLERGRILGAGQGPSTVAADVTIGLDQALGDLERRLGGLPRFAHRFASSSAAGGLRMVTIGLVKELTAEAARQAALGAGAKLVGTFAGTLTRNDMEAILLLAPDIVLLAGGTDDGNSAVILANAHRLAASALACPLVFAGNRAAADEAQSALKGAGKNVVVAANVMPELGRLDVDPARAAIRQIFIDRIVHAKGIDRAAARLDAVLMPTPAAVLEGARLLAEGDGHRPGLGELMVVDVGGATTDIHSVAIGAPAEGVIAPGLPEPYLKRTVEGDLGMRHNAEAIVAAAGLERLAAECRLDPEAMQATIARLSANVERLPASPEDHALDRALAAAAVRIAAARHAGTTRIMQTVHGPVTVQTGKDLTRIATVIGTGGPLAHGAHAGAILAGAVAGPEDRASLRPNSPRLMIDADYALYAVGLLAAVRPAAALDLGLASLREIGAPMRAR